MSTGRSPKRVRLQEEEVVEEDEPNNNNNNVNTISIVVSSNTLQLPTIDFTSKRQSLYGVGCGEGGRERRESIWSRRGSILDPRIGQLPGHKGHRIYNFVMDLIIFLLMLLEITVVVWLAILHFLHQDDLMAIAMLLPIILNFIGATYYLSDETERFQLELTTSCKWATDLLQFPVLGPIFTALKVLKFSGGCSTGPESNYERIEASAIRMRQACGFFSAAPEALVQLTVLLTIERGPYLTFDNWMEIFVVCLLSISLAESNCYNTLSNYYKMFSRHDGYKWQLHGIKLYQKIILFIHALSSIGSRTISSACLKAAALYLYGTEFSFPLVLSVTIFAEIGIRLCCFYVIRTIRFCLSKQVIPSSCYEAINYSWRSTILDYGFQSKNAFVQVVFYVQNIVSVGLWIVALPTEDESKSWIKDDIYMPMCFLAGSLNLISIVFMIIASNVSIVNPNAHVILKGSEPPQRLIQMKGFFHKFTGKKLQTV